MSVSNSTAKQSPTTVPFTWSGPAHESFGARWLRLIYEGQQASLHSAPEYCKGFYARNISLEPPPKEWMEPCEVAHRQFMELERVFKMF